MLILIFDKHLMWSRSDGRGGVISYYYYDAVTWIVIALALVWLTWFFVRRYLRARALRRQPSPNSRAKHRVLKRVIEIKRELSSTYLQPGFSNSIHAIGIGKLDRSDDYCIQIFIDDETKQDPLVTALPNGYRGVFLELIVMPRASFLAESIPASPPKSEQFARGIRDSQQVIIGGISGANTNLTGESGTIGYFCTRKSKLSRTKEIYLLSNSHVFADLRKSRVDDGDLIMQPSPGERESNRPIASLVNFSALKFDTNINAPNHIDAAIAKLWTRQLHKPLIPLVGAVKGYVKKKDIEIGETARKFGRTTGYTEGHIYSIYLDIWIRYDRTGKSAFFHDQFLIEPALPEYTKFVAKGDSGSLVVDANQNAIGLLFGGMAELPASLATPENPAPGRGIDSEQKDLRRIESYGVANPISEVLDRLKIDLLI